MSNMVLRDASASKKLDFTAFMATVRKIITYAQGEHDSGTAQNGRSSGKMWSPETCSGQMTDQLKALED